MIVSSAVRILRACSKVASITGLQGISLSFRFLFHFVLFVVYNLQGQTGRFMVLLNGSQSSGLVNFVPESRLPFLQTRSNYRKRPRRPETGIKDGFEKMECEFPCGIFYPEKQDYLFRCSVSPLFKFSVGKSQKVVFPLLSNRVSWKILINVKQP